MGIAPPIKGQKGKYSTQPINAHIVQLLKIQGRLMQRDPLFTVAVVGDAGVGKSALLQRF